MKQARKTANLTYEEAVATVRDGDIITICYDGVFKKGHWYDDHMLKMFSECRMIHLCGNMYMVKEWPGKGERERCGRST